jgi:ATP-dependent protease ClpP protease subunit
LFNKEEYVAMRQYYLSRDTVFLPDIDKGVAAQVISDLAHLAIKKPDSIALVISSDGGITNDGFAISQFIEFSLNVPVHAEVIGACYSAATYPLLCCKKRVGNELTTFVLHHQTSGITIKYDADFKKNARGWVKDNEEIHRRQVRFYSQKLGISKKDVRAMMLRGSAATNYKLSAKAALKLGLLTKINALSKVS